MRAVITYFARLSAALFAVVLLMPLSATGQSQDFAKVGTTGMVILELPVTPRSAALADSPTADYSPSADALFNNPAVLGFGLKRHTLQVGHTSWLIDTSIQTFGYAFQLGTAGTFGFSVMRFDMGTMQGTANVGSGGSGSFVVTDEFGAASTAFGLTYARRLTDRFSFGGTLRYVTETIADYSTDAIVFDFGMLYYTGFRSLRLAGVMKNFGTESEYVSDPFKMPITFRFGSAMEVLGEVGTSRRVTLMLEALHTNNSPERVHAAIEVAPIAQFMLRGGYKAGYDEDAWTAGAGIEIPGSFPLGIDFVYGMHGRLGNSLGFALKGAL